MIDLALAILPLPEPDPVPLRVYWMRAAGTQWDVHWFTAGIRKIRCHDLSLVLQTMVSPYAVAPLDWPNPLPVRLAEFDRLLGVRK